MRFSALNIDLWPEFDRSALLVVLHSKIEASGPVSITLPLPADAKVNTVAFRGDNDRLLQAQYHLQARDHGRYLIISAAGNALQIEFYLPMTLTGNQHGFDFTFGPLPYPAQVVTINVQKPAHAKDLRGSPAMANSDIGLYKLAYYHRRLGTRPAGATIEQKVVYDKPDMSLTAVLLGMTTPLTTGSSNRPIAPYSPPRGRTIILLWGILLALLMSFGLIAYTMWRYRLSHPQRTKKQTSDVEKFDMSIKYCRQCDHPFGPRDHYCTRCGAPRR